MSSKWSNRKRQQYMRAYYQKHKSTILTRNKLWRSKRPKAIREYMKRWRDKNEDYTKQYGIRYRAAHRRERSKKELSRYYENKKLKEALAEQKSLKRQLTI